MNRTILYNPTIDIPSKSWLRHAILYWDEVSSIVPKSWDEKLLINLSPDIHYLMDEKQFRPINPEDLIFKTENCEVFQDFQDEFKEIVSSPQCKSFIKRSKYSVVNRVHSNKVENSFRIHSNKTSNSIYSFLKKQGLANRYNNDEWINFERNTALLYMSLLAKYLAEIDSQHTTIGTDYITYEHFNLKRVSENNGFPVVSFNINNVLPTPKDNVPFETIVDFKRKRIDNLRHFKNVLLDFQTKVSNSQSNAEIKENAINFKEMLINGVNDLNAVLKDGRIDHTVKSLKSLISLKSPTTLTALGTVINNQIGLVNIPIDLNISGLAIMGAVELTANYIDSKNNQRVKLRKSPFSYIYYAQRQGIINTPR